MRNNAERLSTNEEVAQANDNSSDVLLNQISLSPNQEIDLNFPQPTEAVELPTRGKFYPPNHPLHNCLTAEIRYMTAKDEEILSSKSLLQKGIAVDKMLQGLLVNKNIKVDSLYVGDKNALLIAARISMATAEYRTHVACMSCGEKSEHSFDLNKIKMIKPLSNEISIAGIFKTTLPKTNFVVELRMLTGQHEKNLRQASEGKKKLNMMESPIADQLKQMIVSIGGEQDPLKLEKFIDNSMLAMHSKHIREEYSRVSPDVSLNQEVSCEKCGVQAVISIPFTADFFWSNRKY